MRNMLRLTYFIHKSFLFVNLLQSKLIVQQASFNINYFVFILSDKTNVK